MNDLIASPTAVARNPPIIHQQQPKVHIQAGQQQQSIVLPIRTTPMTTQGSVTAAVTSVSFPVTNQQLTTALPNHPTGAIQTVKIGGGQAQVPNFLYTPRGIPAFSMIFGTWKKSCHTKFVLFS